MNWFNKLTNLGVHKELTSVDTNKRQLLNLIIFSTILIELFCAFCMIFLGNNYFASSFLIAALLNTSLYILIHDRLYLFVILAFNFLCGFFVCFLDYYVPNIGVILFLIIISFSPFLVLKNKRVGYALFVFWTIVLLVNVSFNIHSNLTFFNLVEIQKLHLLALFILISFIFFIIVYYQNKNDEYALILNKKNNKIANQIKMLEETGKSIEESINYAKYLQQAIIPSFDKINNYLPESFILNKPKDILSGDFCWFEHVNDSSYIAVADCTGHGIPGAMVSLVCSNALFRSVIEFKISSPSKILDKVKELVIETFSKNREDVKEGMGIALYKLEGRKLLYSGAFNPLWVIRNDEIIELKADRQPIGKYEHNNPFSSQELELKENDTIYIFSDGYLDQFGGEKGKKYKSRKLKKFLLSIQDQNMKEQLKSLDNEFEAWKGRLTQVDDVCVVGVKIQ